MFKKLIQTTMHMTGFLTLIYLIESLKTNFVISKNIYTFLDRTEAIENINRKPDIQSILKRIFLRKNDLLKSKRRSNERKFNNYEELSNSYDATKFKQWLRQDVPGNIEEKHVDQDELAGLVEKELLNALAKKSSALLDKPYIQKQGRNDFLVIKSDFTDPFLSIVPNDMYYNVEKKCVNWLDDCNQKGLRERLLQKVNSPYK